MEADCPSQDAICDNSQLTKKKEIIATLINTHGLLGQYLRGEADFLVNKQLEKLIEDELISRFQDEYELRLFGIKDNNFKVSKINKIIDLQRKDNSY